MEKPIIVETDTHQWRIFPKSRKIHRYTWRRYLGESVVNTKSKTVIDFAEFDMFAREGQTIAQWFNHFVDQTEFTGPQHNLNVAPSKRKHFVQGRDDK